MGSYDNNNALKILLQRLEVPLAFCNVPQDAIGLPAEHVHFPYCFVLEENLEVKHLFIPDKVVPMLSEEYFKSIIGIINAITIDIIKTYIIFLKSLLNK